MAFVDLPGMLLRYFVHFYDMEIIEEEAFLLWKEDISQEFPGKGKALFQVNTFSDTTFSTELSLKRRLSSFSVQTCSPLSSHCFADAVFSL